MSQVGGATYHVMLRQTIINKGWPSVSNDQCFDTHLDMLHHQPGWLHRSFVNVAEDHAALQVRLANEVKDLSLSLDLRTGTNCKDTEKQP